MPEPHTCAPPVRTTLGMVWLCSCNRLWRLADMCNPCDRYGHGNHDGLCFAATCWRPAQWWHPVRPFVI